VIQPAGVASAVDAVAALEVRSTTQGFRMPVMTTAQRTFITGVEGLQVYDSDLGAIYLWTSAWVPIVTA